MSANADWQYGPGHVGTNWAFTWNVPPFEPLNTLYYQCGIHQAMSGVINLIDLPPPPPNVCASNPLWMPVECVTPSWIWIMDRNITTNEAIADKDGLLATGSRIGIPQPEMSEGLCSLTGTGWISLQTYTITNCDSSWYHVGGSFTGNCRGHDGDTYRLLVLGNEREKYGCLFGRRISFISEKTEKKSRSGTKNVRGIRNKRR